MCSQQDEGQESLEEELDVLVLDDEGDQVSYSPMVGPPVIPKMVLKKEASVCLPFPIMLTFKGWDAAGDLVLCRLLLSCLQICSAALFSGRPSVLSLINNLLFLSPQQKI